MKTIYFSLFLLLIPYLSHAQVTITEIMYDYEGSDSGNEWIEIYNNSNEAIPIASWYFKENDTNHSITTEETLAPQSYLVIVQNIDQFTHTYGSDIPTAKSSFSLNNTGEYVAILDENKELVDSVTYSSEDGGQGDGTSLQYINGTWRASVPTPGEENAESTIDTSEETTPTTSTSDEVVDEEKPAKPKYEPYIAFPNIIVAGNKARFQAGVYKHYDGEKIRQIDGTYYLNFGDGTAVHQDERIDTSHTFDAPGTYLITLTYYSTKLREEAHEEPQAFYQKKITVTAHDISIEGMYEETGITIKNNTNKDIDVGGWKINAKGSIYTFPELTMIPKNETLSLPHTTLTFMMNPSLLTQTYLINTTGDIISQFIPEELPLPEEPEPFDIEIGENVSFLDDYLEKNTDKEEVDLGTITYEYQPEEQEEEKDYTSFIISGILALCAGGIHIYMRYRKT